VIFLFPCLSGSSKNEIRYLTYCMNEGNLCFKYCYNFLNTPNARDRGGKGDCLEEKLVNCFVKPIDRFVLWSNINAGELHLITYNKSLFLLAENGSPPPQWGRGGGGGYKQMIFSGEKQEKENKKKLYNKDNEKML
jgi:hypothetical protein